MTITNNLPFGEGKLSNYKVFYRVKQNSLGRLLFLTYKEKLNGRNDNMDKDITR